MSTITEAHEMSPAVLQPPEEIARGLFETGRRIVRSHPLATDALLAAALLAVSTVWLAGSRTAGLAAVLLQVALFAAIVARRVQPSVVFFLVSALALVQWTLGYRLIGDVALLIALYTVAAHEKRTPALLAAGLLEIGAIMAAVRWHPAGAVPRSFLFLTGTVVAALFAGWTAASGRRYLDWMDERARRLEVERDQQAALATANERTHIARELHDIVSHSLSVVITLADAAALVTRGDPERGAESMAQVSEVGRQALADMRAMLGVLRTDERIELGPQPDVAQLAGVIERVRATGLDVDLSVGGDVFPLGAAVELSVYRIVQEALTNTVRHGSARHATVAVTYAAPFVRVEVADDGVPASSQSESGHGIEGMRERAALHGGELRAGAAEGGGWLVATTLRAEPVGSPA